MSSGSLVVHPGALGDVVIALGPISRLSPPRCVAARGGVLEIASRVPAVGRWIDLEGRWGPALVGGEGRAHADALEPSRIFVFRADPDGSVTASLEASFGVRPVVTSGRPPPGCSAHRHVADVLGVSPCDMAEPWIVAPGIPDPGSVVIHPGSGSRRKRWPIDGYLAVAYRLAERGVKVTWVLGGAEVEDGFGVGLQGDVMRSPTLDTVVRALGRACAYLGNDSGISHLAAALGAPSVLIFGPTAPEVWAPAASWVTVVKGDPAADPVRWGLEGDAIADLVLSSARC